MADVLDALKKLKRYERDDEMARVIGIAPSTLSHYRSGSRRPGIDCCERIAWLLGVDPDKLIAAIRAERQSRP